MSDPTTPVDTPMTTPATSPNKSALTARDTELVVLAFQCLQEGNLKVDWERFAKMGEFKNKASANASFGFLVKHKLSQATLDNFYVAHASGMANSGSTPRKRAAPKPKTPAAKDGGEENGNPDAAETPTKPKKKRVYKPKVTPKAALDDEGTQAEKHAVEHEAEVPASKRAKGSPRVKVKEEVREEDQEEVKEEEVKGNGDAGFFDDAFAAGAEA
ncbi:MAG: hypothetical protein Q9170_006917 [Blastenia crenularia]